MAKIEIENNVYCKFTGTKKEKQIIWDSLSYESHIYTQKKDQYGKKLNFKNSLSFFNKKTGIFYTGFLKKIKIILKNNNINFKVIPPQNKVKKKIKIANLSGITYRDYQLKIIKWALRNKRANIDSKPRSGKTLMLIGIIKSLLEDNKDRKFLILCHDKSIQTQNIQRFREYFDSKDISVVESGKDLSWLDSSIVFSSVQIMSKIDPVHYIDHFDGISVDEVHKLSESHEKILTSCNAEYRIGMTGTIPNDQYKRLRLIGLFGDIIEGLTNKELIDAEILAKPIILIKIAPSLAIDDRYQVVDERGIVNNLPRNEMIIEDAINRIEKNESGLILTTKLQHGKNIQEIAKNVGFEIPFIHGGTSDDERERIKSALKNKDIKCVISNIWKEGVDLPSLNYVIVGFGEKAEERLLQSIMRCLNFHGSKKYGEIIDYLDKGKYLGNHSLQRIETYIKQGWLGNGVDE